MNILHVQVQKRNCYFHLIMAETCQNCDEQKNIVFGVFGFKNMFSP